jgi:hypothetical protein
MSRSQQIVDFIANLIPIYVPERYEDKNCARSLVDGTLVLPHLPEDEEDESNYSSIYVEVYWQGDKNRKSVVFGELFVTPILERYVRLHGTGATEEQIADELRFMSEHFTFKTDGYPYFPNLGESPTFLEKSLKSAKKFGGGLLVDIFKKIIGL